MDVTAISASPNKDRLASMFVIAGAASRASGNGMITGLAMVERWIHHTRARVYDPRPLNRWSREYKLEPIRAAARTMVEEGTRSDRGSRAASTKGTRSRGRT